MSTLLSWPNLRLPNDKQQARAFMKERWKSRVLPSPPDAAETKLRESGLLPLTGIIGIYRPMTTEAPLPWLLGDAMRGRVGLVRARADRSLEFVAWDGIAQLEKDVTGMLAPPLSVPALDDKSVTAILVPGLAFMANGMRMGRGLGCYDRTLARFPGALRVAVTSEIALVESLPFDAHDLPVQLIVTEARVHKVSS